MRNHERGSGSVAMLPCNALAILFFVFVVALAAFTAHAFATLMIAIINPCNEALFGCTSGRGFESGGWAGSQCKRRQR